MARFEAFEDRVTPPTQFETTLEAEILKVDLSSKASNKWAEVEKVLAAEFGDDFASIHTLGMGNTNKLDNRVAQALKHQSDLMLFVANDGVYPQSLKKLIQRVPLEPELRIVMLANSSGTQRRVLDLIACVDDMGTLTTVADRFPSASVTVASGGKAIGEIHRTWRRPVSSGQSWFVQWWSKSDYDNEEGVRYSIGPDVGNRHQVSVGDVLYCCRVGAAAGSPPELFGIGRVGHRHDVPAKAKTGSPSLESVLYFDKYLAIDPSIPIPADHDPRTNLQNSIQAVELSWIAWAEGESGVDEQALSDAATTIPIGSLLKGLSPMTPQALIGELALEDLRAASEEAGLVLSDRILAASLAALRSGKHLLLSGPPGTGKTALASVLAELAAERGVSQSAPVLTTATADWSVADTIGSYRLHSDKNLHFVPGMVLRAIDQDSWLVIDELNRADIDKAIGQLFTVLSGQSVKLPFEMERDGVSADVSIRPPGGATIPATHEFELSDDWRLIATLNDHDKDLLFEMSEAMLRRFALVPVGLPSPTEWDKIVALEAPIGVPALDSAIKKIAKLPRPLGPAIVLDCIRLLRELVAVQGSDLDLVSALETVYSAFIEPQLSFVAEDKRAAIRAEVVVIEDQVE